MDPTIPWYRSAILRQQLAQLAIAATAFFGISSETINWDDTIGQIFAGIAALIALWTFVTRLFKPAPPITQAASVKERELVANGIIPKQRGFASPLLLAVVAVAVMIAAGCTSTQVAYRNAKTLPDTAYVVAEHYAALVKQAADIAQNPATPEDVKGALKAADKAVKPLILGDETGSANGLRDLAQRYQDVRDAQTESELQNAINAAVRELTHFINAVKSARSRTNVTSNHRTDRTARNCASARTPGAEQNSGRAVRFG